MTSGCARAEVAGAFVLMGEGPELNVDNGTEGVGLPVPIARGTYSSLESKTAWLDLH